MPVSCSTILKAVSFLGLAWSAQIAIAALPSAPETPTAAASAITTVVADPQPAAASAPALALPTTPLAPAVIDAPDARQVECMAKVILHEAGARAGPGQVAIAQVIRARVRSGRFAPDVCGVVRQRGQFFDVDAYNPPRGAAWTRAVGIATDVLGDVGEEVAPGALFFHSAASAHAMAAHVRVAEIGGNVFYR